MSCASRRKNKNRESEGTLVRRRGTGTGAGNEVKRIKDGGGIFDVKVDGELAYSKYQTGTFPSHQKLLKKIDTIKAG